MNNGPNNIEMNQGPVQQPQNPFYEEAQRKAQRAKEIQNDNQRQEELVNKLEALDINLIAPQNIQAAASLRLKKELDLILANIPANVRNGIHKYLSERMIDRYLDEENMLIERLNRLKWWRLFEKLEEEVRGIDIEDPELQSQGSYILKAFKRFAMRYNGFELPNNYTYTVNDAYTVAANANLNNNNNNNANGLNGGKRKRTKRKVTRKQKKSRKNKKTRRGLNRL